MNSLRLALIPVLLAIPLAACGGKKAEKPAEGGAKAEGGEAEGGKADGAAAETGAAAADDGAEAAADEGGGGAPMAAPPGKLPCKSELATASGEALGSKTLTFDEQGRLTKSDYQLTNGKTIVSTFTYDGDTCVGEDAETKGDEKVTRTRTMEGHAAGYVVVETDDSRLGKIVHTWEFDDADRPTSSKFEVGTMGKEFVCTYEYPEEAVAPVANLHYGQARTTCGGGLAVTEYEYAGPEGGLSKITMTSGDTETFVYECE